jgi:UV DNA damage endonuclease
MDRFVTRYRKLPGKVRRRLVIENDDRLYSIRDCLKVHEKTGIPIVFDVLHFRCNTGGETLSKAFAGAHATWTKGDGLPIVDYSRQDPDKRTGAHAQTINIREFSSFIQTTRDFDFDIMCEIKDKEESALKALGVIRKKRLHGHR